MHGCGGGVGEGDTVMTPRMVPSGEVVWGKGLRFIPVLVCMVWCTTGKLGLSSNHYDSVGMVRRKVPWTPIAMVWIE